MATGETAVRSLRLPSQALDLAERPLVMGIVNVTPDSFSDGGQFYDPRRAIDQFQRLIDHGADIIDIGGESSRPGAEPVDTEEEWRRVGPVLAKLGATCPVPISIDTYKAETARRALDSGATIVNDISALRFDPKMAGVVHSAGAGLILIHMQGTPRSMQKNPVYEDVVGEIKEFLLERALAAETAGVEKERIVLDPGIGFGKTLVHNLQILNRLAEFHELGYPVLVGASRKAFIGKISGADKDDRLEGSLAAAILAAHAGAQIVRVHDVKETRRALSIVNAVSRPETYNDTK